MEDKLRIFSSCCKNCIMTKDRLVSKEKADQIIQSAQENENMFICHKASFEGEKTRCYGYYQKYGKNSLLYILGRSLGLVEFVAHTDLERLHSYNEMNPNK